MLNVEQTIQSEFANSPTLNQLIANMNAYIDPRADLLAFYDNVWNIDTAESFGLNIWGRIVGVNRVIPIPGTTGSFGFANSDSPPDWQNFGSVGSPGAGGPFFAGQESTGSYTLNDATYKTLILAKALANIAATTAPGLNQLVQNLFPGRGKAYTIDRGNTSGVGGMRMTYVFEFSLSTIEYAILNYSGVLPHPGGVLTNILVIPTGYFGFAESGSSVTTWGFGSFYSSPASA